MQHGHFLQISWMYHLFWGTMMRWLADCKKSSSDYSMPETFKYCMCYCRHLLFIHSFTNCSGHGKKIKAVLKPESFKFCDIMMPFLFTNDVLPLLNGLWFPVCSRAFCCWISDGIRVKLWFSFRKGSEDDLQVKSSGYINSCPLLYHRCREFNA